MVRQKPAQWPAVDWSPRPCSKSGLILKSRVTSDHAYEVAAARSSEERSLRQLGVIAVLPQVAQYGGDDVGVVVITVVSALRFFDLRATAPERSWLLAA
jgi:hypothetical protein